MKMLDYDGLFFDADWTSNTTGSGIRIEPRTIVVGLRIKSTETQSAADICVREAFDSLLHYLEELSGMLDVGLTVWTDIDKLLGYELAIMRSRMYAPAFQAFCEKYGYRGVGAIIANEGDGFPIKISNPHWWLNAEFDVA